ncbi:MAG: S26 family signal peptidase [Cyanobacteria bacterium J06648_11]
MPISSSKPKLKIGGWLPLARVVVRGESMAPTLQPGDRLLVLTNQPSYLPGDIVVFTNASRSYVKRLVGVPRQHVEWHGIPWELGADEYFATGDNCEVASIDSRTFGPVPHRNIHGRVVMRYFPSLQWLGRSTRS